MTKEQRFLSQHEVEALQVTSPGVFAYIKACLQLANEDITEEVVNQATQEFDGIYDETVQFLSEAEVRRIELDQPAVYFQLFYMEGRKKTEIWTQAMVDNATQRTEQRDEEAGQTFIDARRAADGQTGAEQAAH